MREKTLLIISDTPMWYNDEGRVAVFEPTLREIEEIAVLFDEVIWLGFNRKNYKFGNGRTSSVASIRFKPLIPTGGHRWISKIKNLILLPYYVWMVIKYLVKSKYVHTRGPSIPAFITTLLSFVFRKKKYWNKYAGNWSADKAPLFYRIQKRLLLKATFSKVTINGRWDDQLPHIVSFENPCFTEHELLEARQIALHKKFEPPYTICFVGRLESAKGVGNMLEALGSIEQNKKVAVLILAGAGELRKEYEKVVEDFAISTLFTGALNRDRLNEVYSKSHFLLLPSQSEGFPKVVSEAVAYGCIPVITNISALDQYVKNGVNGFFLEDNKPRTIQVVLDSVLERNDLQRISSKACEMADAFTYQKFIERIRKEVFYL